MWHIPKNRKLGVVFAIAVGVALIAAACGGGVPKEDHDAVKAELSSSQSQLASVQGDLQARDSEIAALKEEAKPSAPSTVVQVGQLQPAPAGSQPSGWATKWSEMLGIELIAQLDSSGPDAWDPKQHPLVYVTAQGPGYGSSAFGGAFISEVQKAPGLADHRR